MHRKIIFIVAVLTFVFGAGIALANDGAFADFNAQYPGKSYGCTLCHTSPPALNPYGAALLANGATGANINPATFVAVEPLDSDTDTFTNLAEINAGTLPGDPASHPPLPGETITITNPNGGETVPSGAPYAVLYTASAGVASVKGKYSIDGGLTWLPAVDAGGSTPGSFNWSVPTPKKNLTKARFMLLGYNSSQVKVAKDKSDAVFTIETVTITAPAAGATVSAPSQVITWTTNGTKAAVDNFALYYSTNNGLTWKRIFQSAAGAGNPGTYTWDATSERPIPAPANPKSKSLIKLILKDSTGNKVALDISDKFTIQ